MSGKMFRVGKAKSEVVVRSERLKEEDEDTVGQREREL